jgi:hypothetical protein
VPQGPSLIHAVLGTNVTQVKPGGSVTVTGGNFPPDRATRIQISWTDSSSPALNESDIQWGTEGTNFPSSTTKSRQANDGQNNFIASGLKPGTSYRFRVRDCDKLTCSQWTDPPVTITTQASNQVTLLIDFDSKSNSVGSVVLGGSDSFSTMIVVPANAPAGNLKIWAELAGSEVASTTITVLAAGQVTQTTLAIIQPATGAVLQSPAIEATFPLTVRGEGFQPGDVLISIDGNQNLGNLVVDSSGIFIGTFTWPTGFNGNHMVKALQLTGNILSGNTSLLTASAPVLGEGLPT